MIIIVPDLPFSLLPIVEAVMAKITYWIYLMFFYTTGETVLISAETIFATVVAVAFLAFITSIAADVRYFLERPMSMRDKGEANRG